MESCPGLSLSGSRLICILPWRTLRLAGGHSEDAPSPPILAKPGQDSEPRSNVPQFTEDGDCGDLSDDGNCNAYSEHSDHAASLPEYTGQSRTSYLANLLHGVEGSEATSLARRVLGRDVGYSRGPGGPEGRLADVVHGAGSSHADKRGDRHVHHRRSNVGGRARGNPDQTPVAVGDPAIERAGKEEDRRRKAVDDPACAVLKPAYFVARIGKRPWTM